MPKFGIDISRWQKGINFDQIKAEGVGYIILRGAYTTDKDSCFDGFYNEARARNIPLGVYQYSMATTPAEGQAEALYLIQNVLKGKEFDYPIYLDCEDSVQKVLGKSVMDNIITTWAQTMESNGYYVGIYTNLDFYKNYCSGARLAQNYSWWMAQWTDKEITAYPMWQFGGGTNYLRSTIIAGHTVDQDYCYKDFSKEIREAGKNGFTKGVASTSNVEVEEKQGVINMEMRVLTKGMKGADIHAAMVLMKDRGYYNGVLDNLFGNGMEAGLLRMQKENGLGADGILGNNSWNYLLK